MRLRENERVPFRKTKNRCLIPSLLLHPVLQLLIDSMFTCVVISAAAADTQSSLCLPDGTHTCVTVGDESVVNVQYAAGVVGPPRCLPAGHCGAGGREVSLCWPGPPFRGAAVPRGHRSSSVGLLVVEL